MPADNEKYVIRWVTILFCLAIWGIVGWLILN